MAQKTIPELNAADTGDIDDNTLVPMDSGVQTFKMTLLQLWTFFLTKVEPLLGLNRMFIEHKAYTMGPYGEVLTALGVFPAQGFCKNFIAPFDCEIVGVAIESGVVGTSGTTVMDVHKISDNGATDDGTIFDTKPSVSSAANSDRYLGFSFNPDTEVIQDIGTAPENGVNPGVLSELPYPLDKGESLRFDIDSVMGGSPKGIALTLYIKQR